MLAKFWPQYLSTTHMFSGTTNEAPKKPSMRRDKLDTSNNTNGLNVTPEFKNFVAGKLAELIDQ